MAATTQSTLEAAMSPHLVPARVLSKSERLRKLAAKQRREGMAGIRRLRTERRWLAKVAARNPGVGQFFGAAHTAEQRAEVAAWAFNCRARANAAASEARAIEASVSAPQAAKAA